MEPERVGSGGLCAEDLAGFGVAHPLALADVLDGVINVWLRTLGNGYFHLQIDGQPTVSGRTGYLTPTAALATIQAGATPLPMTTAHVPDLLGCIAVQMSRTE